MLDFHPAVELVTHKICKDQGGIGEQTKPCVYIRSYDGCMLFPGLLFYGQTGQIGQIFVFIFSIGTIDETNLVK